MDTLFLAAISGEAVLMAIIYLVIAGLIIWLIQWGLTQIPLAEPFKKIIHVVLIIVIVVLLINFLLSLVGRGFISW